MGGYFVSLLLKFISFINELIEDLFDSYRFVTISFDGVIPKLRIESHEMYIESLKKETNILRFHSDSFDQDIVSALEKCRHCDYIIISVGHKFIQFYLKGGEYILDFPMFKTNNLEKYKYNMLGILAELGFLKSNHGVDELRIGNLYFGSQFFFSLSSDDDKGEVLKANFRKDRKLVTTLIKLVFQRAFQEEASKIRLEIG